MQEVTLTQMLDAREKRVYTQKNIISKYKSPLISFTMNIAGPVKHTPAIERAFWEGMRLIGEGLKKSQILSRYVSICHTGCEAVIAVNKSSQELKALCTYIEENTALGRLFDMDVLDTDGRKLERQNMRGCLVCGAKGRICSSRRLHSIAELQKVTYGIIREYFECKDAEKISKLAVQSLIDEVNTSPKPGLVDRINNGSHSDMTIDTFIKSALSLEEYFKKAFLIGVKNSNTTPSECFKLLRTEGIEAEKIMYEATNGVNTHKGIIYSMGVICTATGRLWKPEKSTIDYLKILWEASKLVHDSAEEDFRSIAADTAGGRLYLEHGIKGIRGEAAEGFPSVRDIAIPVYTTALKNGESANDAGVRTLIHLIANVKDTNIYNRGGVSGAQYAARCAREIIESNPDSVVSEVQRLDNEFIKRNLSPGGCADLLAITYFIKKLI